MEKPQAPTTKYDLTPSDKALMRSIERALDDKFSAAAVDWTDKAMFGLRSRRTFDTTVAVGKKCHSVLIRFDKSKLSAIEFPNTPRLKPIPFPTQDPKQDKKGKASPARAKTERSHQNQTAGQTADIPLIWDDDPEKMLDAMFGFKRQPLPEELVVDPVLCAVQEK